VWGRDQSFAGECDEFPGSFFGIVNTESSQRFGKWGLFSFDKLGSTEPFGHQHKAGGSQGGDSTFTAIEKTGKKSIRMCLYAVG